jgi:hypothetical protein
MGKAKKKIEVIQGPIKLDLGCGPNKKEGFVGIDQYAFDGKVDRVMNVGTERLPYEDGTVDEIHTSHFMEHLSADQRCHVINEAFRVLKVGGQMTIIVPHFGSSRAYGDPTHVWPPMGEMWFYYLDKNWRTSQAPHTDKSNWDKGYDCDFMATWGYSMNPAITTRNQEFQQFAMSFYKEAINDIHATLTKR